MLKFLVLAVALLGSCYGHEDLRLEEEEGDVPLDFLMMSGANELETMFGYEMIEFIHNERMRCDITNRKEELKFSDKMDHMMRYFRHAKHTIEAPEFEQLARANKKDFENNFRKAFKDIELGHLRKLSRLQTHCDHDIEMFMEDKMRVVLEYAFNLLQKDPAKFTRLLFDVSEYRLQLQYGLNSCVSYLERHREDDHYQRAGNPFELCYGNEVFVLIQFITNFTEKAESLSLKVFHVEKEVLIVKLPPSDSPPADLEDGDDSEEDDSGDGKPDTEEKVPTELEKVDKFVDTLQPGPVIRGGDKEATTSTPTEGKEEKLDKDELKKVEEVVNKFEPGPVLIRPTEKAEPTTAISKSDLLNRVIDSFGPGPVILDDKDKPVAKTDPMPTTESKLDLLKKLPGLFEPGPVILDDKDKPVAKTDPMPTTESKLDLLKKLPGLFEPGPVILDDKDKPVAKTDPMPTTESKLDLFKKLPGLFEPGPVIIDPKPKDKVTTPAEPTKKYPKWAEEAFEEVQNMEKSGSQEKSGSSGPQTSKTRSRSKSQQKEDQPKLSIDLDLPGVDAGLGVEIGPGGVRIGAQGVGEDVIVFDDVTTTEAPEIDPTHRSGHQQFKVYFLIYFFATLGILLAITMLVLIVLIVRVKCQSGGYKKDTPLISEEEKIAVMKQSGYVNPTYKFFDQVEDV